MAAIIEGLTHPGSRACRVVAGAARAVVGHRVPGNARRRADLADLADLVRLYGSLAAYEEEQRRCGLLRLEVRLRGK